MGKYEYQSRVRYSECGEDCRLHLPGAVNYFQDAATFQGEDLGIGIPWMKEHHLAWILVSWQIIMDHMPRLGEPIRVSTWAYDFRSFYGLRNLLLEDEKLFSRWNGLTASEAAELEVDTVSGATWSSDAVIHNVRKGLIYYLENGK